MAFRLGFWGYASPHSIDQHYTILILTFRLGFWGYASPHPFDQHGIYHSIHARVLRLCISPSLWPTWHAWDSGESCCAMAGWSPLWVHGWDAWWPRAWADEDLCDTRLWDSWFCAPRRLPYPRSKCASHQRIYPGSANDFVGRQCPLRPCPWLLSNDCCH